MIAFCSLSFLRIFAMSNASASYPELVNAYTTTGFPLAFILSNSSVALSACNNYPIDLR